MRRALLIAAMVAGGLAPFAGAPHPAAAALGAIDVHRLANSVEAEEDHVTAVELAGWIRNRKHGLRIIDLRTPDAYAAFHVPSAANVSLSALVAMKFEPDETIVLVSEGGGHAAQGWVLLQASGYRRVYFLRGGVSEWLDDVMEPINPSAEVAELSRYFGGNPRTGESSARPVTAEGAEALRRRGC